MTSLCFTQLWLAIIGLITVLTDTCSALILCSTATWQNNGSTVAGDPLGTSGSNSSELNTPTDVYISDDNMIYVLDARNRRVQRFPPNSTIGTTVVNNTFQVGDYQFTYRYDMSVDGNGSIFILDGESGWVAKWAQGSVNGTLVAGGYGLGNSTNQMNGATGMFVDLNTSTIWIADTDNHRIVRWTSPTAASVVCGSYGLNSSQFRYPQGLFMDTSDSNKLYVADTRNHRIQLWVPGATSGVTLAGMTGYYGNGLNQLWNPRTLLVDNRQNMFIVDQRNNRILKWMIGASSGMIIAGGSRGIQPNLLFFPWNINFDSTGSLFVADSYNYRVQKFLVSCPAMANMSTTTPLPITTTPNSNLSCAMTSWSSNATTIAGSPIGWSDDTSINIASPSDVFIDRNGSLYVSDSAYLRVQRFLPNSTVGTTIISGSDGSHLNQFSSMDAIGIDLRGNIYILDAFNYRVTKWTPGAVKGILVAGNGNPGNSLRELDLAFGMFVEFNTSIIWIADTFNHRVVKWQSPLSSIGILVCGSYGSGAKQFNSPSGLFVDTLASNTLYVADTENQRVQLWLPGATSGTTIAGQTGVCGTALNQLCSPTGLTKDLNGYIYIADSFNNRIMKWMIGDTSGRIVAGAATYGVLPNQLNYPNNVKLDANGAVVVADTGNDRIQKFSIVPCTTADVFSTSSITTTSPTSSASSKFSTSATVSSSSMIPNSPTTASITTTSPTSSASSKLSTSATVSSSSMIPNSPTTSSMIRSTTTTTTNKITTTTNKTTTATTKASFACNVSCPQWLLILVCSVIITINN